MKLYIIRHGKSPSTEEAKVLTDAERPLSEQGRQDIAILAKDLKARHVKLDIILSSPLRRAFQTARELAATLNPPLGVKRVPALSPNVDTQNLWQAITWELRDKNSTEIAVVGHQPQLDQLVINFTQDLSFGLKPGGAAAIELNTTNQGKLLWAKNP